MKTVGVAEFKAKCTKYLDEVVRRGEALVITRRGKKVAEVRRAGGAAARREELRGSVFYHGSVIRPVNVRWEADAGR